jgi:outer membrane protein TolC
MRFCQLILIGLIGSICQPGLVRGEQPILSLAQAVEMALAKHPVMSMAKPAADIMQAKIRGERASLYPKVTARFVFPFVGTESGVSMQQYIWDFGQTQHRIQAEQAAAQASGFDQAVQREDVILNVKVAYYNVLIQQLTLIEAEYRNRSLEKRLEQIASLFKLGRRSQSELTQVRMNVDQVKLNVATARHDVENARIQLAFAMGLTTALPYDLAPEIDPDRRDVNLEQTLQSALTRRNEVHRQEAQIAALRAQAAAAKEAAYPTIFGRMAWRIEGEGAEQPGFVVGIGLQGTLFDGFATPAKRQEAEAQVRQAEAEMTLQKQKIVMEVKQAVLRLQLAMEQMQTTHHSQREARQHLEFMREQFRLGRVSTVEMAEAELLDVSATAKRDQSIYHAKIALAQLDRMTGKDAAP